MNDDGVDATASISVLYKDAKVSTDDIKTLATLRKNEYTAHARGVCSRIYRLPASKTASVSPTHTLCVKRVVEDDQWPPHSVSREIQAYRIVWSADHDEAQSSIMPLLAAFHDDSDAFNIEYDLVMPWHPCTLQHLLDEPAMQDSGDRAVCDTIADAANDDDDRPALAVLPSITVPYVVYTRTTMHALFSALRFLHAHGIAHRDVKPSNIIVQSHDATIKMIDFGTCWLSERRYAPGDDGRGGTTSEVGTGAYRSPESLLSPKDGYDGFKVDVWQAAATLSEFLLPLRKVPVPSSVPQRYVPAANDRLAWERALWDGDQDTWAELGDKIDSHASPPAEELEPTETSPSGWRRETLFDGARGDLGLADSIFTLCGLPNGDENGDAQWPEAKHFQPSLAKLPFRRRQPAEGGVAARLASSDVTIVGVLQRCLQLSASKRISAEEACSVLMAHSDLC